MSENSFSEAVKFAAPTNEQTTGSEVATSGASAEQGAPEEQQEPRTFTQEDVDRIAARERAAERRRYERELREREAAQSRPSTVEPPKRESFKNDQEYLDAYVDFRAEQKIAEREQKQHQTKVDSIFDDRMDQAREKYSDFDAKMKAPGWYCSEVALSAIKESDIGPEIAYHLASNPKESERIFELNPVSQIREIGKLEAKLLENPPAKKSSSAPDPINPVGARAANSKVDVTDPRSDKLSAAEWIAARNKQVAQQK